TLAEDQSIQVILINFLGTIPQVDKLPEIISQFWQLNKSETTSEMSIANIPHLVLRLVGSQFNDIKPYLATLKNTNQSLILAEDLDEAAKHAVRLVKSPENKKKNREVKIK
ncbi:MAG: succinate--CoA ligase subunit beta, partial [Dolichospermum sp.]